MCAIQNFQNPAITMINIHMVIFLGKNSLAAYLIKHIPHCSSLISISIEGIKVFRGAGGFYINIVQGNMTVI